MMLITLSCYYYYYHYHYYYYYHWWVIVTTICPLSVKGGRRGEDRRARIPDPEAGAVNNSHEMLYVGVYISMYTSIRNSTNMYNIYIYIYSNISLSLYIYIYI